MTESHRLPDFYETCQKMVELHELRQAEWGGRFVVYVNKLKEQIP